MAVMHPVLRLAAALALVLTPLAAAAGQDKPAAPSQKPGDNFGDLPDSTDPVSYSSPEGEFSVTFPAGCARLYTKMNGTPGASADVEVRLVFVNCERDRVNHEGCQVNARLGAARGLKGQAATDMVLAEIRKLLDGYGVVPGRQRPVRADFGDHGVVEGLEIMAHPQSGAGDVWIRGLLRGDDVYFLIAWKANGGLMEDPAYGVFFQSFQPWAE